jgi:hypothetical protein
MLLAAATAQAQTTKYDNGYKYGLLSNIEVGVGGIYSYEITNAQHHKNAGAQLLLTKRIGDYWRIRGVAEVNGFIPNKFDRFGKGMLGVGAMDKTALRKDKAAVDAEIERIKRLASLGGFIPCPDHRLMPGSKFELVQYYAEEIKKVKI